MPRFSANLGFLWTELPLPDAIRAAACAGFDAVECHWPFDTAPKAVRAALRDTGLPMLGLNTRRGNTSAGENGLAALVGRTAEAKGAINEALDYADAIGAHSVHVMAGVAKGAEAQAVFEENLRYACARAGDRMILVEPLNVHDAPGYFLRTTGQAQEIIARVACSNLKLMFDCYHVARAEGDPVARLRQVQPILGHIQFAGVPDRGPPDSGTVAYAEVFDEIDDMGWQRPLGAEYRPSGDTDASLSWLSRFR
ncbi:MAG: TIM barrel protein [Pseudomonadota bacterium]